MDYFGGLKWWHPPKSAPCTVNISGFCSAGEKVEGQDLVKCRLGTFAHVSALWPASRSFWELCLRYLCSSVKGIFTLWCFIQLIQMNKNTAWEPGIFDSSSLWPRFPFWHIKITLLHQKKTPGQKSEKAGSSPFLNSKMVWGFHFYVVVLFQHSIFPNVMGILGM